MKVFVILLHVVGRRPSALFWYWPTATGPDCSDHLGQVCFLSPRSKINTEKQHFSLSASHVWNNSQKTAAALSSFKLRLKTSLFASAVY